MAPAPDGLLILERGCGIRGDANAHPCSPRQVLVTRTEELAHFRLFPGDLRENVAISGLQLEDFQPGHVLKIGPSAAVRLTFYCEPCKRIGHLLASFKAIQGKRGILGVVLDGGSVRVGDRVAVEKGRFTPLPSVPADRFTEFVRHVPPGRVVTFLDVAVGMGVANSYVRAIPGYIKRAAQADLPVHRIVDAEGQLPECIPAQWVKLEAEGVQVGITRDLFGHCTGVIDLARYRWPGKSLYLA